MNESSDWAIEQRREVVVLCVSEALKHSYEITRADGSKETHIVLVPAGNGEKHIVAVLEPGDTIRQSPFTI